MGGRGVRQATVPDSRSSATTKGCSAPSQRNTSRRPACSRLLTSCSLLRMGPIGSYRTTTYSTCLRSTDTDTCSCAVPKRQTPIVTSAYIIKLPTGFPSTAKQAADCYPIAAPHSPPPPPPKKAHGLVLPPFRAFESSDNGYSSKSLCIMA